jgi:hypothetical protein
MLLDTKRIEVKVEAEKRTTWEKIAISYPPYYQQKLPPKKRVGVCTIIRNNAPFLREVRANAGNRHPPRLSVNVTYLLYSIHYSGLNTIGWLE